MMNDDDEQPDREPIPRAWREEFRRHQADPADRVQGAGRHRIGRTRRPIGGGKMNSRAGGNLDEPAKR
jgi:hypothetical protein